MGSDGRERWFVTKNGECVLVWSVVCWADSTVVLTVVETAGPKGVMMAAMKVASTDATMVA